MKTGISRAMKAAPLVFLLLPVLAWAGQGGSAPEGLNHEAGNGLTSNGSAPRVVRPGDRAQVQFLCRFPSGEVAAETDRALEPQTGLPKSAVFLRRVKDGPLYMTAADPKSPASTGKEEPFEVEIMDRLARFIVGMREGDKFRITMQAEDVPERTPEAYVVKVARVRERAKSMEMVIDEYKRRMHKEPKVGQPFIIDPAVPGRVESVTKDKVVIRFSARDGAVIKTPFGAGLVTETKDAYEIKIDAKKDALVRSGPFVGRITGVDGNYITIDYRNPFGGEKLVCDVAVEKIADKK